MEAWEHACSLLLLQKKKNKQRETKKYNSRKRETLKDGKEGTKEGRKEGWLVKIKDILFTQVATWPHKHGLPSAESSETITSARRKRAADAQGRNTDLILAERHEKE